MGNEESTRRTISRRDFVRGAGAAGVGGLAVGGAAGFLAGRAGAETAPGVAGVADTSPIRIVSPGDLTGDFAPTAEEESLGIQLAMEEINAMGGLLGRQLEFDDVDTGNIFDPAGVRAGFTRAVETMDPDVIIAAGFIPGPGEEISADAGVIYLNGSTQQAWADMYDADPERFWGVFQVDPVETVYGTGFVVFVDQLVEEGTYEPREKNVAIIDSDDPYGTQIADVFQEGIVERGWTIHSRETTTIGTVVDWGPILAPLRANPPALVFCTNPGITDNASMARQWHQNPLPSLLYQQYAPSEAEYMELVGDTADGIIWSTVLGIQADDIGDEFRAKFRERHGREPSIAYAGHGYDCVYLWATAVALAGDPTDARQVAGLISDSIHRGTTGGISFPEGHYVPAYPAEINDPSRGQGHIIAQIRNGEQFHIFPEPYVHGEFELPPWMS